MYRYRRAVIQPRDDAAEGRYLLLELLGRGVRAVERRLDPAPHNGYARSVKRVLRALGVRAQKPTRAEQNSAEIPRHDADDVAHTLAPEHLEHRYSRRALRLAVIGIALRAVLDDIAPAVMPRVIIFLLHLRDEGARLLLALHGAHMPQKLGALLGEARLARRGRDAVFSHAPTPCELSCNTMRRACPPASAATASSSHI